MVIVYTIMACIYSYLQQLEVSYLIIERHLIKQQKKSIYELFSSQPEGLVVYCKPKNDLNDPKPSNYIVDADESKQLEILFSNNAIKSLTDIDFESLKNYKTGDD
jgi:hypothetical protein